MAPLERLGSSKTTNHQINCRWGELSEDEPPDLHLILPPKQVIGPDENGIKKVIEFRLNNEGRMVKVTTTMRMRKTRLNKRAIERRSWAKFGDAVDEDVGSRLTMVSTEEIRLERHRPFGGPTEETKTSKDALGQIAGKGGGFLMVCRNCGKKGDHWTSKCPLKDLESDNSTPISGSFLSKKDLYVPPSMRNGGGVKSSFESPRGSGRDVQSSIRVGNLSEDVMEMDLQELFSPFGRIKTCYIFRDFKTGLSKGCGFIKFYCREDAEKAIDKLNGYGYDNLILDVSWFIKQK